MAIRRAEMEIYCATLMSFPANISNFSPSHVGANYNYLTNISEISHLITNVLIKLSEIKFLALPGSGSGTSFLY